MRKDQYEECRGHKIKWKLFMYIIGLRCVQINTPNTKDFRQYVKTIEICHVYLRHYLKQGNRITKRGFKSISH